MSQMANSKGILSGTTIITVTQPTPALLQWIQQGVHSATLPTATIQMYGSNNKEMEKLVFTTPSLTSVTFPLVNSKAASYSQVAIIIHLRTTNLTGTAETTGNRPVTTAPKWSGKLFGLKVGTLDTSGVLSVTGITFSNTVVNDNGLHYLGGQAQKVPVSIIINNNNSKDFSAWFNQFTTGQGVAQPSTLTFKDDNGNELCSIDFTNMMIGSFNIGTADGMPASTAGVTIQDVSIHT
jgi:hypothetical protein